MRFGQLILTPGYECDNENTDVYSVMALPQEAFAQVLEKKPTLFTSEVVRGAIFFQHHMMYIDPILGVIKSRGIQEIKEIINTVKSANTNRIERGLPILECIFDAEPCPVQQRRYYRNPPQWPITESEQAKYILTMTQNEQLNAFLDNEIEAQGFFPLLPSNRVVGAIADRALGDGVAIANALGQITGRAFAQLGINVLFAPVCDLAMAVFSDRCYSERPKTVVACATAWCMGALSQPGIDRVCLKHAPGHGVPIQKGVKGTQDTHSDICRSDIGLDELKKHMDIFSEIVKALMAKGTKKSAISIMTNHIIYNVLDKENPVSSSSKAIDFIKESLPCEGIDLIVDCINMASFSQEKSLFLERLNQASTLHTGGTIVTTHFVKKLTREAIVKYCEAVEKEDSVTVAKATP